jgi:hypothetical protein
MPSPAHVAIVELVRASSDIIFDSLGAPSAIEGPLRDVSADLTVAASVERRADLVLVRGDPPISGLIVEVQLRWDSRKLYTIPYYQAAARDRYRCPVRTVVLTPSRSVEERLALTHDLGDGATWTPTVLGPSSALDVAGLAEHVDAAREPYALALAGFLASHGHQGAALPGAAFAAIRRMDDPRARDYAEILWRSLASAPHVVLEELMNAWRPIFEEYRNPFARVREEVLEEGREEGREEGARDAALRLAETLLGGEAAARLAAIDDSDTLIAAVAMALGRRDS